MSVTVLGVDPSLNNTGLCWGDGVNQATGLIKYSPKPGECAEVMGRVRRLNSLTDKLDRFLEDKMIDYVMTEEYSYSSRNGGEKLAEFGGILRCRLALHTDQIYEIAPTQLKKFVLGKGAGGKDLIMMEVLDRWGVKCRTADEADAYVLYRIGLCFAGICEPENQAQREVMAKLKGK